MKILTIKCLSTYFLLLPTSNYNLLLTIVYFIDIIISIKISIVQTYKLVKSHHFVGLRKIPSKAILIFVGKTSQSEMCFQRLKIRKLQYQVLRGFK